MSLLTQILGGPVERKTVDATNLLREALFGGASSKAGVSVTVSQALRVSTTLACVKVIAEDVSKVPFKLFQEQGRAKEVARRHPLHMLLTRRPNDWQTPAQFKETLLVHALLSHGGYAYKSRSSITGEILELIPLLPSAVIPKQDPRTRAVAYEVEMGDGERKLLARDAVLSLQGLSWNGYAGLEGVRLAAEAIGLAVATEEAQARLHKNGSRPGGILVAEGELKPDQVKKIKGAWDAAHGELAKWGGTAVLDRGMKYTQLALSGADAQTLEARKFQVEDQARFFRVYPQIIGYSDKAPTYASAEQFNIAHVIHTLMPWATRLEQAAARDLLTDEEAAGGYFFRVMLQGLLRGDSAGRSAFYKSAINDGWMTRNEVRALEELDALDGLDVPLAPQNMGTVGKDGTITPISKPTAAPATPMAPGA